LLESVDIPDSDADRSEDSDVFYSLKITNNSDNDLTVNELSTTLTGSFEIGAVTGLNLYFGDSPTDISEYVDFFVVGSSPSSVSFTGLTNIIPAHSVKYFNFTASMGDTGATGDILLINGATDPVIPVFSVATGYTNQQVNNGATVSIDNQGVLLSTVNQGAYTADKSTADNMIYILQVFNTTPTTYNYITDIAGTLFGTNVSGDTGPNGLKIYLNTTPNLSGSPILVTSFTPSGATSYPFSVSGLMIPAMANEFFYMIFTVDIYVLATTGHILKFEGATAPVMLTITGSPVQDNAQRDNASATITVGT
jgi:hypothetical protein